MEIIAVIISTLNAVVCSTVFNRQMTFDSGIIFYDQKSNKPLQSPIFTRYPNKSTRLPIIGEPCSCNTLNCGCCSGLQIQQFNFNQQLCSNFTYHPQDFAVQMDVFLNDNNLYSNSLSAKNPPPLCIPIPIPYLPLDVSLCIKLSDIFTSGRNIHMCMDVLAQLQKQPLIILHFDCMRMGEKGVALLKPGDNSWISMENNMGPVDPEQTDSDIFDQVTEIKHKNKMRPF